MNPTFRIFAVALLVGAVLSPAAAGPLEEGMDAYQEKDYLKAVQVWRPLAQAGDADAQYRLGVMYAEGKGVAPSDAEAALWFERAAEQGNASAQYNLGASYAEGVGVRKDMDASARWFRRAADQGNVLAQLNLGLLYASGAGVSQDYVEAMKWIDLAIYALPAGGIRSDAAKALGDVATKLDADQIQDAKGRERRWKAKAEPKGEPKPVAKAEAPPDAKADAKPEPKPDAKPAAKSDAKPAAK